MMKEIKNIQPLSHDKVTMIFKTSSRIVISTGLVSKGKLNTHILGQSSVPSMYLISGQVNPKILLKVRVLKKGH